MTACPKCAEPLSDSIDSGLASLRLLRCPHCGHPFYSARKEWQTGWNLIRNYFLDVWLILTRPNLFFKMMPLEGGIIRPLTFALVTHWLGATLSFLWSLMIGGTLGSYLQRFIRLAEDYAETDFPRYGKQLVPVREKIMEWFSGVGPVIIDPFFTLIKILFTAFLVFVGARIFVSPGKKGSPEEVTYESAVRIVAFGMTPAILVAFPFFGNFFASLGVIIVTVIGAKEAYRVGTGRAVIIALFPKILFLGIITLGLLLFVWIIIAFFAAFFA